MNKKLEDISVFVTFILALGLISYHQFKTDVLYSYDAYWQIGISRIIAETGDVVYEYVIPPYSINETFLSMGYIQMAPISTAVLNFFTNANLFISAKIYIVTCFVVFVLSTYVLVRRLTDSHVIGLLSSVIVIFTPIIFYRMNILVAENSAVTTWLLILLTILISRGKKLNCSLIPLFVCALAMHPRCVIFYLPLAFVLYFSLSNKSIKEYCRTINDHINGKIIFVSVMLLGIPFFKFFALNFFAYLKYGAIYPLYPPSIVVPLSATLIFDTFGFLLVYLSLLGLPIILTNSKTDKKYLFLMLWIFLVSALLFIGTHLRFPTNRLMLHLCIISAISASVFIGIFIKKYAVNMKIIVPTVLMICIVVTIASFYDAPYNKPFMGWGTDEKEGVLYLSEILDNGTKYDYVIFTPEISLPFGYGLKHIEIDEKIIANVLKQSKTLDELLDNLKETYPNKNDCYIITGVYSKNILSSRFIVIKELSTIQPIYNNSKLKIYHFSLNDSSGGFT